MQKPVCLVADIGGTNTRIALTDGDTVRTNTIARFKNDQFSTFYDVISTYLTQNHLKSVDRAVVAVAGPVANNRAEMTNLDWTICADEIAKSAQTDTVGLLNDLQAQGHSLGHLAPSDIATVSQGTHVVTKNDTQIVIGMGTGFNAAPVYHNTFGTFVPPAEIGHARITVGTEMQKRVYDYVEQTEGFVSNEHILAGRGLERIDAALNNRTDRSAAAIMEAANSGDALAITVAKTQASFAGSVYGDMALATLPLGGIYLIGGVARALIPYFQMPDFRDSFQDKGRFCDFNAQFSVHVILDDFAALKGCASFAMSLRD